MSVRDGQKGYDHVNRSPVPDVSGTTFLPTGHVPPGMQSVRKGLRSGDLEKDNYERLRCTACGEELGTENDPDEVGSVRVCPACGGKWQQVG